MAETPAEAPDPVMDRDAARGFCAGLTDTVDALIELLEEETRLIREARLAEAAALSEEKTRLAQHYGQAHVTVKHRSHELSRYAPVEIDHLRRRHQALDAAMSTNLAVLATARTVSETLIRSVAESAAPGAARPRTYSAEARKGEEAPPVSPLSLNVAL